MFIPIIDIETIEQLVRNKTSEYFDTDIIVNFSSVNINFLEDTEKIYKNCIINLRFFWYQDDDLQGVRIPIEFVDINGILKIFAYHEKDKNLSKSDISTCIKASIYQDSGVINMVSKGLNEYKLVQYVKKPQKHLYRGRTPITSYCFENRRNDFDLVSDGLNQVWQSLLYPAKTHKRKRTVDYYNFMGNDLYHVKEKWGTYSWEMSSYLGYVDKNLEHINTRTASLFILKLINKKR